MKCALCGKESKLQQSHIIPKLVYTRIKSHKNSRFRSLDDVTKIMQDGEKRPMLCHDCEELFSSYEVKVPILFLDDYLETNKLKKITSGVVDNYILTVAWRVLWDDLYRLNSFNDHFSRSVFEYFCSDLGQYLLKAGKACNVSPPKEYVSYVFALNELVKDKAIKKISEGCLFGYGMYFQKSKSFSVIVFYAGLVFVTDYKYDKNRIIFIGQQPVLFRRWIRKKEITEELYLRFAQTAKRSEEAITPELKNKIIKYYKTH